MAWCGGGWRGAGGASTACLMKLSLGQQTRTIIKESGIMMGREAGWGGFTTIIRYVFQLTGARIRMLRDVERREC